MVGPSTAQGQRDDDVDSGLHDPPGGKPVMSNKSTVLLEHHLKELKLPTFLKEYDKVASKPVRRRGS